MRPQFLHPNVCTASSRRVGCGSTAVSFICLRHLGQESFIKRSKDIMHPLCAPPPESLIVRNPKTAVCIKALTFAWVSQAPDHFEKRRSVCATDLHKADHSG